MGEYRNNDAEVWQQCDRRIQPGAIAPNILMPLLFRSSSSNADSILAARHVLLFWASWCGDCKAMTDSVRSFQQCHSDIPWVTVSLDYEASKAREYIREHHLQGLHFFDGRDWRGDACTDYAVALHGIPYIIYIDDSGRIRWTGSSMQQLEDVSAAH